jgi:hypothetical protein
MKLYEIKAHIYGVFVEIKFEPVTVNIYQLFIKLY